MGKDRFQWGIVGCGAIANKFAEAVSKIDGAEVYAAASRNPEKAQQFAQRWGASKVYRDEELVKDPAVDAVYIAVPHSAHAQTAEQALLAGKPVLCEKPLTVNLKQAERLIALAQRDKVFLMEAMWMRTIPIYQKVRHILNSGVLGELTTLNISYSFLADTNPQARLLNLNLAGGALLDIGVYCLHFASMILESQPDSIVSSMVKGRTGVDLQTSAVLQFPSGVLANINCHILHENVVKTVIAGTRGRIELDSFFAAESASLFVDGEEPVQISAPFEINGFEYEIREAMRCIQEGRLESGLVPHAATLSVMGQMDEIRRQCGLDYPAGLTHESATGGLRKLAGFSRAPRP